MHAQEVIIDPFLLCLPNPCNSLDQLEIFISSLVGWRGFVDRPEVCLLMSDSTKAALNHEGEFPHHHRLAELISRFECTVADAHTIFKIANTILQRTPTLEEHFGINAVLIDESSCEIIPGLMLDRLKPTCRSAFRDDLLIAGVIIDNGDSDRSQASLMVASGSWTIVPIPEVINVKGDLHEVDLISSNNCLMNTPPFSLLLSIPVAFSHEQLIKSLSLWEIWDGASSEDSVRLSIKTCITNLISIGVSGADTLGFVIGSGFVQSLHLWGAGSRQDYAMITIESCARIVLGIPKNDIKEFGESAKETAKQRTRNDGALAFRTHLTKKGVGLRLMFWRLLDGTIEFANIGSKDELEIS